MKENILKNKNKNVLLETLGWDHSKNNIPDHCVRMEIVDHEEY